MAQLVLCQLFVKKTNHNQQHLKLKTETCRTLTVEELKPVAGGSEAHDPNNPTGRAR